MLVPSWDFFVAKLEKRFAPSREYPHMRDEAAHVWGTRISVFPGGVF